MGMSIGHPAFEARRHVLGERLHVAPLDVADAPLIGLIMAALDPWKSYPISATELTRFFTDPEPGAPRFAITVDETLVGAVAIRTNWFRGPYIQTFALDQGVQGQGIGTAIMAWIEREARAGADRNLWVAASDFNARALAFYARLGFERVAVVDGLIRDERAEVLLRKRLF
jgi:diamine N-acetyltransferase